MTNPFTALDFETANRIYKSNYITCVKNTAFH